MPRINGKTIWVTAASSGIGEALTHALNEKGCKLLISARRVDGLQRVKKKCSNPDKVAILEIDISVDKKLMDTNYLGTLALTKAFLPHFIQNKAGHFVTVRSLMGKFGSLYRSGSTD